MNEKEYYNLIKPYEDAMQMILSRLDTLNHTLYESSATHLVPIHNIQSSTDGSWRNACWADCQS